MKKREYKTYPSVDKDKSKIPFKIVIEGEWDWSDFNEPEFGEPAFTEHLLTYFIRCEKLSDAFFEWYRRIIFESVGGIDRVAIQEMTVSDEVQEVYSKLRDERLAAAKKSKQDELEKLRAKVARLERKV